MSTVAQVINREAAGVRVLKLSAVVIPLLWSSAARLTWLGGHGTGLRGTCPVITCAEVSDRRRAAGGHNLAVFLFAFNTNLIGFVFIFVLIQSNI